jgi:hypothetical protein
MLKYQASGVWITRCKGQMVRRAVAQVLPGCSSQGMPRGRPARGVERHKFMLAQCVWEVKERENWASSRCMRGRQRRRRQQGLVCTRYVGR